MTEGVCRLVLDAARRSSIRYLSREHWSIYRLIDRPRHTSGVVRIGGRRVSYIDGLSTFHQWADIFRDGVLRFRCDAPSPLIIDGGANVGLATIHWQAVFVRPEIIAIEPCSAAYECLTQNVGDHHGATLIRKALWSVAGQVPFRERADDSSHVTSTVASGDAGTVDAITLGGILDGCRRDVDLLKLDIEGAEVDVLQEARQRLSRVRRLFVEYHQFSGRPQRLAELLGLIDDAGFGYVVDALRRTPRTFDREPDAGALLFTANVYAERDAAT
jgi:FkbM family methyltransferase